MSTGQTGHCHGVGAAGWALVDSRIALDVIPRERPASRHNHEERLDVIHASLALLFSSSFELDLACRI
jgi:hypothetical protein